MLPFLGKRKESEHEWTHERMSAFLDGQLPADEGGKLEQHVRLCESCSEELQSLRATRQLLRAMPMARVPRAFTLAAAPRPVALPRSFFYLRAATTVAAACFVGLLAVSVAQPVIAPVGNAPSVLKSQPAAASAPARGQAAVAPTGAPAAAPQRAAAPAQEKSSAAADTAPTSPATIAGSPPLPPAAPPSPQPYAGAPQAAKPAAPASASTGAQGAAAGQAVVPQAPTTVPAEPTAVPTAAGQEGTTATPATAASRPSQPMTEPTSSASALAAPSAETRPAAGITAAIFPLQLFVGAATALLAIASGSVWWIHRRRR